MVLNVRRGQRKRALSEKSDEERESGGGGEDQGALGKIPKGTGEGKNGVDWVQKKKRREGQCAKIEVKAQARPKRPKLWGNKGVWRFLYQQ